MSNLDKAIIRFAEKQFGGSGFEFTYEKHYGDYYLTLKVDAAKMDKNSGHYDEEYFKKISPKREHRQGFLDFRQSNDVLNEIASNIKKFFGIDSRISTGFELVNYHYLDEIEHIIKSAIKLSSDPSVKISFQSEYSEPKVKLIFYGLGYGDAHKKYIEELNEIINNKFGRKIDFTQYQCAFTLGKKPES